MALILFPEQVSPQDSIGGKAGSLLALARAKLPIPDWFVVTPAAFYASLPAELGETPPGDWQADIISQAMVDIQPGAAVVSALERALIRLCPDDALLAVRSSAVDEDSAHHSFAGQLESFLGVEKDQVARYVADVWRSAFSARVLAYRTQAGLPAFTGVPAVLVQRMVDADQSGVAFAADPASGRRSLAVIASVYGLASALVSGDVEGDTFQVDRQNNIVFRHVVDKPKALKLSAIGIDKVVAVAIDAKQAQLSSLEDRQIVEIAELARQASRFFSRPQDIEWAYADKTLYLVQSRPITSLYRMADPDGQFTLWDNSNIVESYGGITTPLTYSFARSAYREVYRQFCRILGVTEAVIQENNATFSCMIGLIRGRVYYNLLSWYTALSLLPGFSSNRRFMEQMMGVKEALPQALIGQVLARNRRNRSLDVLYLLRTVAGLLINHFSLETKIKHFYARLDAALTAPGVPLEYMRPDQLCSYYRELEQKLLTRWDAPLINDFFAMIFHGLLRRLTAAWCADGQETLANDLLCGEGGMISAEPAQRLKAMARLAATDPQLVDCLRQGNGDDIETALAKHTQLHRLYQDYLERFGERCIGELKLESRTLADEPLSLLRCIGELAAKPVDATAEETVEQRIRRKAENQVASKLAHHPLRKHLLLWVLSHARRRVRDRENLRFERTRLFGRVRRLLVEFGHRLYALNLLDDPRDIFYLEVEEILAFVEGTATTTRLCELAALRKAEFDQYRQDPPPAPRFSTRGIVYQGHDYRAEQHPAAAELSSDELSGLGCCAGKVQGVVHVVRDPGQTRLSPGEILVAEFTDPGWIMLFPAAAGIVVERGSLLSHSAIVARELGIPAIVGVNNATQLLKDGDRITMDGATGLIHRLADASP